MSVFNTNCQLPRNYKLDLYTLLFLEPMCEHMGQQNNTLHTLIIGNSLMASKVFDIVLSNGQFSRNIALHITVATDQITDFKKHLSEDCPALKNYITLQDEGTEPPIPFENFSPFAAVNLIDLHNCSESQIIGALNLNARTFDYVFVADDSKNLIHFTKELAGEFSRLNQEPMIVFYDPNEKQIPQNNIRNFANCFYYEGMGDELLRIAKNINFAYEMAYDAHAGKKISDQKFNQDFEAEFHSENTGIYDYSAESSIAVAASIPMKLACCTAFGHQTSIKTDPMELLCRAIMQHNDLFSELIYMEHRRWTMFMVTRGFRYPETTEMGYIYTDGNDHRSKKSSVQNLHMCIADASPNGLNPAMNDPAFWNSANPPENLSGLDYSSWFCHRKAVEKTNAFIKNKVKFYGKYPLLLTPQYKMLNKSIEDLLNVKSNSAAVFKITMADLKAQATENNLLNHQSMLSNIEKDLDIVIKRNSQIDFYKLDDELISKLPFALWHEKNYGTIIVFGIGKPVRDVMVPFLLSAKKCVFFFDQTADEERYKKVIREFLTSTIAIESENLYFRLTPKKIQDMTEDDISETLKNLLNDRVFFPTIPEQSDLIVYASDPGLPYPTEILCPNGTSSYNLCYVKYKPQTGIRLLNGERCTHFAGLSNKCLSVKEYIRLCYGTLIKEQSHALSYSDYEKMASCFTELVQKNPANWYHLCQLFNQKSLPIQNLEMKFEKNIIIESQYTIKSDVFYAAGLDLMLPMMALYHLILCRISPVVKNKQHCYYIEIASKSKTIIQAIQDVANGNGIKLTFNPFFLVTGDEILKKTEGIISDIEIKEKSRNLLQSLKEHQIIKSFSTIEVNGKLTAKATFDPGSGIYSTLKKQGDILEWLTYYKLRETGLFNDVQIGQHFAWSGNCLFTETNTIPDFKAKIDQLAQQDLLSLITPDEYINALNKEMNSDPNFKAAIKNTYNPHRQNDVSSEIDVIAIAANKAVFISCKTDQQLNLDKKIKYLHEIKVNADRFDAIPVFVYSTNNITDDFIAFAVSSHISLLNLNTLNNPDKLSSAVKTILSGAVYRPEQE